MLVMPWRLVSLLLTFAWAALFFVLLGPSARGVSLFDLVDIEGVRDNPLVGYGLIVGLQGTGDQTRQVPFTSQSTANMLRQLGVQLPENSDPRLKNTAAVMVSADMPTYARPGQRIDVTVMSLGDAKSLRGGSLMPTPLKGIDGRIYALAQGPLYIGGVVAEGASGSKVNLNIVTVGQIPSGAIIERSVIPAVNNSATLVLNLKSTCYRQARNIVKRVDDLFGLGTASATDGRQVVVRVPTEPNQRVAFVSALEDLQIESAPVPARVIVNARTGTIVIGQNVRIRPVSISHGSLMVTITEEPEVSQPGILSEGTTEVVQRSDISVKESRGVLRQLPDAVSLDQVTSALNSLGATPSELISILQAIKRAGALEAELEII